MHSLNSDTDYRQPESIQNAHKKLKTISNSQMAHLSHITNPKYLPGHYM